MQSLKVWTKRVLLFIYRAIRDLLANDGFLLAGAISYNALLSFVPLVAALVIGSSFFFEEQRILQTISQQVNLLLPGKTDSFLDVVRVFLDSRDLAGGIGLIILLFFSSISFRVLRDSIKSIFSFQEPHETRNFWLSATLPYLAIFATGIILISITLASSIIEFLQQRGITLLGYTFTLTVGSGLFVYGMSLLTLIVVFTGIYKILPIVRIPTKRALVGGITAGLLWDITRRILVYYFTNLSMINVIYGSLTTIIVVLVSLEIGALILLFGAQVVAQLELNARRGLKWYEAPSDNKQTQTEA